MSFDEQQDIYRAQAKLTAQMIHEFHATDTNPWASTYLDCALRAIGFLLAAEFVLVVLRIAGVL